MLVPKSTTLMMISPYDGRSYARRAFASCRCQGGHTCQLRKTQMIAFEQRHIPFVKGRRELSAAARQSQAARRHARPSVRKAGEGRATTLGAAEMCVEVDTQSPRRPQTSERFRRYASSTGSFVRPQWIACLSLWFLLNHACAEETSMIVNDRPTVRAVKCRDRSSPRLSLF